LADDRRRLQVERAVSMPFERFLDLVAELREYALELAGEARALRAALESAGSGAA